MRTKLIASWKIGKMAVPLAIIAVLALSMIAASNNIVWLEAGQGRTNWHSQPLESTISNQNVGNLNVKWANAGGDVSATPSVSDGVVYYPDYSGNLYAVDATTGAVIWQDILGSFFTSADGLTGTVFSRTTPTIDGNVLYVGLQNNGWLLAISRNNGKLLWKSQLDTHPAAIITQSPADYNGVLYVGMSSMEEYLASFPGYNCCTFRGSLSAVDEKTGNVLWKTYTVPDNGGNPGGYSGAAVWGSTPVVDPSRKLVYITTGNNYTVPDSVANGTTSLDPNDYVDAILAVDINTHQVVWAQPHLGLTADTFNAACFYSEPGTGNCPDPAGPDYDFGQGVMEVSRTVNGKVQDLVIAGQKSGKLWALDADTGQVAWMYDTGVGYLVGGMEFGSATDGKTVYFANAYGGFWGAVDIASGQLKWKTYDPNLPGPAYYANDVGGISYANGVVYVGSLGGGTNLTPSSPTMFALDANTGKILWQYASGSSVAGSPAIVNGVIYWGSGYGRLGQGVAAGTKDFYAFSLK
jgi:polyvinyl alcohol dehydrogenase (cytochrome)